MDDLKLKVFFISGVYFVGNLIGETEDVMTFDFPFMLVPQQDKMAMMPFGMNMAVEKTDVYKAAVSMIADAVDALKADYTRAVGDLKAARAGIVLAPAGALNSLPKQGQANQRPDVQKLI
jgi:hypothetical protein